jgi:hypothetical protein
MSHAAMLGLVTVTLWFAGLLAISSCKKGTNGQSNFQIRPIAVSANSPSQSRTQMESRVTLRVHEQSTIQVMIELKNDSDHPIYVSYQPPKEGNTTTFLSYGLERRTTSGAAFRSYGPDFHFVPKLSPIASRTVVLFKVINPPKVKGEYRMVVGYYDDEEISNLINKKAGNLTNEELQRADENRRFARSDTFHVRSIFGG